jgi:hypothetical protein
VQCREVFYQPFFAGNALVDARANHNGIAEGTILPGRVRSPHAFSGKANQQFNDFFKTPSDRAMGGGAKASSLVTG